MAEIKKGDVVRIKSGGPRMTAESFVSEGGMSKSAYIVRGFKDTDIVCVWFEKQTLKRDVFKSEVLMPAPESEDVL